LRTGKLAGLFCFLIIPLCLLVENPLRAELVINEFFPDPAGADSGKEFVELINTGPGVFDLEGVELQFANGATGPPWETRWQAGPDINLQAGERFLLVDRNWLGSEDFQVEVWLGLQNGPDAIRLLQNGRVLDLVGYGPLTDPTMMELEAADHSPGFSLARKPDGNDTGNNHLDFFSSDPTPGFSNFRMYDLRVESLSLDPPSLPRQGQNVEIDAVLHNAGLVDFPVCGAEVLLQSPAGDPFPVLETLFAGCRVGNSCQVLLLISPASPGRFTIFLDLGIPDGGQTIRLPLGSLQVGPGPLLLSEVLAAPTRHQGEWIEFQAGDQEANLELFQIRDEEGDWRGLPDFVLSPGQMVIVAQDSLSLLLWQEENLLRDVPLNCPDDQLAHCLRQLPGSWPSLNNSPPAGRLHADRVYLADEYGVVVDHVNIPDSGIFPNFEGASWERVSSLPTPAPDSNWRPSAAAQGSTPGCASSFGGSGDTPGLLAMEPKILEPDQGIQTAHIRFDLDENEPGWHLEIYDLWGVLVRDLGGEETDPGLVDLIWDGRNDQGLPVERGGYVVLLNKCGPNGTYRPAAKILVAVR
jgi:Lamin Tail Domain/FlgD Ig-like domain